jgi:hypothetical protein
MAEASGPWPAQKGFVIFNEAKIVAVIERHAGMRRGIEGTYAVEGNRIMLTKLVIDTAPEQGAWGAEEFTLDGDTLTITWLSSNPAGQPLHHVDTFRRRRQPSDEVVLLPPVAIYASDAPTAPSRPERSTPIDHGETTGDR